MFSIRHVFFIIFIYSLSIITLALIVLSYLYVFDTIELAPDIKTINLITSECENFLS